MSGTSIRLMFNVIVAAAVMVVVVAEAGGVHHHVAGNDRGWDTSSDLLSWSSNRTFYVGDNIWFAYSAAQESVVELQDVEEYKRCDTKNAIQMFNDGLNVVSLKEEGIRYFVSGNLKSCKNGLKVHVEVIHSARTSSDSSDLIVAVGPTPSTSTQIQRLSFLSAFLGILFCNIPM